MTARYFFLSTVLALSLTAGIRAQDPPLLVPQPVRPPSRSVLEDPRVSDQAVRARQMQEDVTVFRVLLNRNLARYYGFPALDAKRLPDTAHTLPAMEGVYLKGHGVVFSASVPTPSNHPVRKQEAPAPESSPWDRTRRELRGEQLTTEKKPASSHKKALAEVVLDLLAENGQHFKQLAPEERITIALSLRSSQDCTNCHSTSAQGALMTDSTYAGQVRHWLGKEPMSYALVGQKPPAVGPVLTAPQVEWDPIVPPRSIPAARPPDETDILLGDLQYKQGRYQEAEQTYVRALQKLQEMKDTQGQLRRYILLAGVCSRLASCAVARGEDDKAKRMMETARKFSYAASKLGEEKPGKDRPVHLPAQLVISATKTQLDQAGSRKISFEDFSKASSIEYRTFDPPAGDKKDGMK